MYKIIKPCKYWHKLPASTGAGFLPSTVRQSKNHPIEKGNSSFHPPPFLGSKLLIFSRARYLSRWTLKLHHSLVFLFRKSRRQVEKWGSKLENLLPFHCNCVVFLEVTAVGWGPGVFSMKCLISCPWPEKWLQVSAWLFRGCVGDVNADQLYRAYFINQYFQDPL